MTTGEVVKIDSTSGDVYAVWIRRNKNGRPVVRRLYYGLGAELTVDRVKPLSHRQSEHPQNLADAVAALLAAEKRISVFEVHRP